MLFFVNFAWCSSCLDLWVFKLGNIWPVFLQIFFLPLPPSVLPCMSFWNPVYEHIRPLDIAKRFLICENQFYIHSIYFSSCLRWEYRFFPCYSITARSTLPYLHFLKVFSSRNGIPGGWFFFSFVPLKMSSDLHSF